MFKVKDREHIGGETVGHVDIPSSTLLTGGQVGGWYDIKVGKQGETQGQLLIYIKFSPAEVDTVDFSVGYDEAYFPETRDNHVTLYQDADTPPLPVFDGITNSQGVQYVPSRCWSDLYHALCSAERLIYITGWSVHTKIHLIRGQDQGDCATHSNVGTLLKEKAAQGVKVLIMTWNDRSNDGGLLDGMMGTHDEETAEYFAGTGVVCANVSRWKKSWMGLGGEFVSTCYTHHQKTIIVDAPPLESSSTKQQRLVAFMGGLDITDGRYDTPVFPLFSTIKTLHDGDFYQNCTAGGSNSSGPREPWHDIHARVEGPATRFIIKNFVERWKNQNPEQSDCLVSLDDIDQDAIGQDDNDPWSVQILRSITADSALFDLDRQSFLHRKYGRLIDNSIEKAYIKLIRNAKSFIYLENQYFLGSAYSWLKERDTRSHHIIPMELTQKIVKSIKANKQFKVYVCVPMYPEGDPTSAASQEILYWQHCTMEAMYKQIAEAIQAVGGKSHPQDYLNFYCLGKREGPEDVPDYLDPPEADTPAAKVRETLRHPIYVHSKLMITDDTHILLGSANINQRSLDGNRDSEICLAGHQPTCGSRGHVHTFRLALWSAHLGGYHPSLLEPGSDMCLGEVRRICEANWSEYVSDEVIGSNVHMLPYPVSVSSDGWVTSLPPPLHQFPDTEASVLGTKSSFLPAKLTT